MVKSGEKIFVVNKFQPFGENIFMVVASSKKAGQSHIRTLYPKAHTHPDGSMEDRDSGLLFSVIEEKVV